MEAQALSVTTANTSGWVQTLNNSANLSSFLTTSNACWPVSYGTYHYHYHTDYCNHTCRESKMETSYNIVRALMKSKILKVKELEEFFEAIDAVAKAL